MSTLINRQFPEVFDVLPLISARDLNSGASTGLWLSPSDYCRFFFMFSKGVGTSSDQATIIFEQAEDTSGTGTEDLDFTQYRKKEPGSAGVLPSGTGFEIITPSAATNSFEPTPESEVFLLWDLADAAMADDNKFVRATIAATTSAQAGCMLALGQRFRNQGEDVVSWL